MKKIISSLLLTVIVTTGMQSQEARSEAIVISGAVTAVGLTMLAGADCIMDDSTTKCKLIPFVTTTGVVLLGLAIFKEMKEVQPDALVHATEGITTPALESVVEKIQAVALEQGEEVSLDEVVSALIEL